MPKRPHGSAGVKRSVPAGLTLRHFLAAPVFMQDSFSLKIGVYLSFQYTLVVPFTAVAFASVLMNTSM